MRPFPTCTADRMIALADEASTVRAAATDPPHEAQRHPRGAGRAVRADDAAGIESSETIETVREAPSARHPAVLGALR